MLDNVLWPKSLEDHLIGVAFGPLPFDRVSHGPGQDREPEELARDDDQKEAWGRPVGLLQLPDGSILVSDDGGNRVWRVSWRR